MRDLVKAYVVQHKDDKFLKAFEEDIDGWVFTMSKLFAKIKNDNRCVLKKEINGKTVQISLSKFINIEQVNVVIAQTISNVAIMSYRYGLIKNTKEYKNMHSCKFIGSFVYNFMQHLPIELDEVSRKKGFHNRQVNAVFAYYILIDLMSIEDATRKSELSRFIGTTIKKEILNRLQKRPILEEWIYIYCRTLDKVTTKTPPLT